MGALWKTALLPEVTAKTGLFDLDFSSELTCGAAWEFPLLWLLSVHMNPALLCGVGCRTSTRSLAQTCDGFSSSETTVPYWYCRYTLLITFQESLADPRNRWSEAARLPQHCWPTPAAAWAAPAIFITWAELMCARNPWAASAPSEMTATALWADCREGVPCHRQRFFNLFFILFTPSFQVLSALVQSWPKLHMVPWWERFCLTPPFSPEVLFRYWLSPHPGCSRWRLQPPSLPLCRIAAGHAAWSELVM